MNLALTIPGSYSNHAVPAIFSYARDDNGDIVHDGHKKGVPVSDVWDIPFLNPKAKERVGYPTQKPIPLLERIITLVTSPGGLVLDPFCGSGTTLVAADLLGRNSLGIDVATELLERLADRGMGKLNR